jgi:DNA-binding NtrC family response regulator
MAHKYSVLIIDDQPGWRSLLVELIEEKFAVKQAESYREAIDLIEAQQPPFHVVVTDLRLEDNKTGNEDGLKVLAHLNRLGDATRTIVVTGYPTISSARQALANLSAADYLEKHPSDGSKFNVRGFQNIVYEAAQDAESKRPDGNIDVIHHILLLEPNPILRSQISDSLGNNGYRVYAYPIDDHFLDGLRNDKLAYALILLNEKLAERQFLDELKSLFPQARLIILTLKDIKNIFEAMRDHPVLAAIPVQVDHFDPSLLREYIHSALADGARKYIQAKIVDKGKQPVRNDLRVGESYTVLLSIFDTPVSGATPVQLSTREEKKGHVQLHLFAYARYIRFDPASEFYWDIPLKIERPHHLKIVICPQVEGPARITIDIDENHRWLGRVELTVNVLKLGNVTNL